MSKRDYYEVLGVSKNASEAELKKAYRRAAQKHHPDRNPDDKQSEDSFKECKEAWEVLSDSQKRAAYDQFGHAGVDSSMGGGAGPGGAGFGGGFNDIFGDVFGDIFGAGRGGRAARLPRFRPALQPGSVAGRCRRRHRGQDTYSDPGELHGVRWQRRQKRQFADAPARPAAVAARCACSRVFSRCSRPVRTAGVAGSIITDPCHKCHGKGRVSEHKTLSVKVPAGVDTGDRIRLAGEGEAGESGGPPGDLYVQIQVKEHAIFVREENNLFCEVPISFTTAALGGELEVPTLNGRVNLKIPAETQTGRMFRMRGKGVKPVRGGPRRRPDLQGQGRDAGESHSQAERPAAGIYR